MTDNEDDDLDIIVHGPLHVPMIDLDRLGMSIINSGESVGFHFTSSKAVSRLVDVLTEFLLQEEQDYFIMVPKEGDDEHPEVIQNIIDDLFTE